MDKQSQITKPEIHYFDNSVRLIAKRFESHILEDPQSYIDASEGIVESQQQIRAASHISKFLNNGLDKETEFDKATEEAISADEHIASLLKKRSNLSQAHTTSRKVSSGAAERVDGKAVEIRDQLRLRRIAVFAGRASLWNKQQGKQKSLRSAV